MSKYLSQVTEVYRVNSEAEAAEIIEEAKQDNRFTLLKSSTEYKPVKAKGELIDEYWKLTLVKFFTSLKEPDTTVAVSYTVEDGYFPTSKDNSEEEDSSF